MISEHNQRLQTSRQGRPRIPLSISWSFGASPTGGSPHEALLKKSTWANLRLLDIIVLRSLLTQTFTHLSCYNKLQQILASPLTSSTSVDS